MTDERGKLDINAADELTFYTLFTNNGFDPDQSELLAAAIMDWRDSDEVERVNGAEIDTYLSAGLEIGQQSRGADQPGQRLAVPSPLEAGLPFSLSV